MGGGGGKAPEPKKFESPAIDNSPATHPIPNFFQGNSVARPQSPYEAMQAIQGVLAPQNPFQGLQGGSQAPLLRREENQQPDILALLKLLSQGQR